MSFDSLGLAPALVRALAERNYTAPTPIQAEAIPHVLAGHDPGENRPGAASGADCTGCGGV